LLSFVPPLLCRKSLVSGYLFFFFPTFWSVSACRERPLVFLFFGGGSFFLLSLRSGEESLLISLFIPFVVVVVSIPSLLLLRPRAAGGEPPVSSPDKCKSSQLSCEQRTPGGLVPPVSTTLPCRRGCPFFSLPFRNEPHSRKRALPSLPIPGSSPSFFPPRFFSTLEGRIFHPFSLF